jgi:hypothetical protein
MSSAICGVLRVIFPLAVRWLMARMVLSMSSVIPCCLPKMFVTRLLVCPVSKATRTSSHARRLSLERIRLSIAASMIGVSSALYARSICCWSDRFRNAAPALERLSPSRLAIRANSSFTTGSTQRVSFFVRLLGVGLFCERGSLLFNGCSRVYFVSGAGWRVRTCADAIRALSCLTAASPAFAKPPLIGAERYSLEIEVFHYSP